MQLEIVFALKHISSVAESVSWKECPHKWCFTLQKREQGGYAMAVVETGECGGEPWLKRRKHEHAVKYGKEKGLAVSAAHVVTFVVRVYKF